MLHDITGRIFGRLTVLNKDESRLSKKHSYWYCLCECGTVKSIRSDGLRKGGVLSCGCLQKERTASSTQERRPDFYKNLCEERGVENIHGVPEYNIWRTMRRRCSDKVNDKLRQIYSHISVSPEWQESFESFYKDMGARPTAKHQLDRIDNTKGYSPENCRWATPRENNMNKSDNRPITWNGVTKLLCEWEEELIPVLGIKRGALWARLTNYGWSVDRAFTTPHQKSGKGKQG